MNYDEALDTIHGFSKLRYSPSLDRIRSVMPFIGEPHKKLKFIHIGGTNGKGTVSTITAAVLQSSGYKVGLFTSPYVEDFCERMRINGVFISHKELTEYTVRLEKILSENSLCLNEFEFITAVALWWFYEKDCDAVVLEVGLGGEYDPTNVIEESLFSAITSVSLDHVNILGDTIEKIAANKAGIIKPNGTVIVSASVPPCAAEVISNKAKEGHCRLIVPDMSGVSAMYGKCGSVVTIRDTQYLLPTFGRAQQFNIAVVTSGVDILRSHGFNISDAAVRCAFEHTRLPARAEHFRVSGKDVILDGGHNAESVENLTDLVLLHGFKTPCTVVFSSMSDKAYGISLEKLSAISNNIIFTSVNINRAENPEKLSSEAQEYNWKREVCHDPENAVRMALNSENETVIICGSFYLAGEVRKMLTDTTK